MLVLGPQKWKLSLTIKRLLEKLFLSPIYDRKVTVSLFWSV